MLRISGLCGTLRAWRPAIRAGVTRTLVAYACSARLSCVKCPISLTTGLSARERAVERRRASACAWRPADALRQPCRRALTKQVTQHDGGVLRAVYWT